MFICLCTQRAPATIKAWRHQVSLLCSNKGCEIKQTTFFKTWLHSCVILLDVFRKSRWDSFPDVFRLPERDKRGKTTETETFQHPAASGGSRPARTRRLALSRLGSFARERQKLPTTRRNICSGQQSIEQTNPIWKAEPEGLDHGGRKPHICCIIEPKPRKYQPLSARASIR